VSRERAYRSDGMAPATHGIYLLRHVKSSWDDPGLADHDRPLAPRGRSSGKRLRRHIRAAGLAPDLVLCSSAVRAVQTCEAIRAALPPDTRVEISGELYGADAPALLCRLNGLPESVRSVLVIGHSPAIDGLAIGLVGTGDPTAVERMTAKYPTGGLAVLATETAWAELGWNAATVEEFVVPREL
jgi:phosphohistidine phosphatase